MMTKKKNDEDRKPIEQEIADLQRKFRVLENDKRAYSEDSQGIIRKQRATIEKLTRENRKMKQEVNETRATSGGSLEHKRGAERAARLTEKREEIEKKLKDEVEALKLTENRIDAKHSELKKVRQDLGQMGGVEAEAVNTMAICKQIRILEDRLNAGLQKFNVAIAANKKLRDEIDTLRRERAVFDDIYKKLENELQQKKKEMANIIEQANAAYEARDSAQAQMAALKQQADKEHAEFEKEWTELGRLIENDKKMKEFMRQRHRQQDVEQRGDLSADQEEKMKKKVTASAWGIAKDKTTINTHVEKIQSYEEAFAKIQAATGISDVDELVQNFLDGEDQNFTVFNFTTGQNDEIEKLEQQIQEYKTDLEQLRSAGGKGEDAQNKQKVMASLEEKWNNLDKKAEHYELKYQQTVKTVTSVRAGVQSIFNRLGCIPPDGSGSGTVTESNTMQYLGLIEQRTNEIKQLYATLKEDDDEDDEIMPPRGNASSQLQIKLPSTVEDYDDEEDDDDEDDQRPFTREELKMKTMRGISKKQEKKGARRGK
jgi:DNA repair exonuclease SbcCD ATPase subunit